MSHVSYNVCVCVCVERERFESTMNDIFMLKYWTNPRVYQESFFFKEMGPEAIMGKKAHIWSRWITISYSDNHP